MDSKQVHVVNGNDAFLNDQGNGEQQSQEIMQHSKQDSTEMQKSAAKQGKKKKAKLGADKKQCGNTLINEDGAFLNGQEKGEHQPPEIIQKSKQDFTKMQLRLAKLQKRKEKRAAKKQAGNNANMPCSVIIQSSSSTSSSAAISGKQIGGLNQGKAGSEANQAIRSATGDNIVGSTLKRRSGFTSGPARHKKKRIESNSHTKDRTSNGDESHKLNVAIIDRSNPWGKIQVHQAEILQQEIEKALDAYLFAPHEYINPPIFERWWHENEILKIICVNVHSLMWLQAVVKKLPQLWEAICLEVVELDKLPRPIKCVLWIPGTPEDIDMVQHRLRAQNGWANTFQWYFLHTAVKDQPTGRLIIYGIEKEITELIKAKECRLYYKLSSLKIKIADPNDAADTHEQLQHPIKLEQVESNQAMAMPTTQLGASLLNEMETNECRQLTFDEWIAMESNMVYMGSPTH